MDASPVSPARGSHAILTLSIGLEWEQPLLPEDLATLKAMHPAIANDLPRAREEREIVAVSGLPSGIQLNLPIDLSPRLASVTFDRLQPDGSVDCELVLRPQVLAINLYLYDGWTRTRDRACRLAAPVVRHIARIRPIKIIGLQYIDQFVINGPSADFRAESVFDPECPFLPRNAFTLRGLWHAHHGFFERLDVPDVHRRLTHLNVDVVDTQGGGRVNVLTAHRALLDAPIDDPATLIDADGMNGQLSRFLNALHDLNKDMLLNALAKDVAIAIGLAHNP